MSIKEMLAMQLDTMRKIEPEFFDKAKALSADEYAKLKNDKLKDYILLAIVELTEIINELNYKPHKKHKEIDWGKVSMETIDSLKYILCIAILQGISDDELCELFTEKTKLVNQLYDELHNN